MDSIARLLVFALSCGLGYLQGQAGECRAELLYPELTDLGIRIVRFTADTEADEVLVVQGVRHENDHQVLETEEVCYARHAPPVIRVNVIELGALAPDRADDWLIRESTDRQHLAGFALEAWRLRADRLEVALRPLPGRATRAYRFLWSARVEKWSAVKRRHPHLPELGSLAAWTTRAVFYPAQKRSTDASP